MKIDYGYILFSLWRWVTYATLTSAASVILWHILLLPPRPDGYASMATAMGLTYGTIGWMIDRFLIGGA